MSSGLTYPRTRSFADYLYVFAFLLANVSYIVLGASTLGDVFDVQIITTPLNILIYSMLLFVVVIQPKNFRVWIFSFILIIVGLIIFFLSGEGVFLLFILFMLGKTNIDTDQIILLDFFSKFCATVFVMLLGIERLIPTLIATRGFGSDDTLRHSLGFSHYNILGALVLSLILEWIYIRKNKLALSDLFIIMVVLALLNHFVNSRTSVIVGIIGVILVLGIRFLRMAIKSKFFRLLVEGIYIEAMILSVFAAYNFRAGMGTGVWDRINAFLSSRISIAQYYVTAAGFSILPKELKTYLNTGLSVLDNTYVYMSIRLGIVALVIFLILMTILGHQLVIHRNYYGIVVYICFAIFGLMESTLFYCTFNFMVIYLASSSVLRISSEENPQERH